jgi:nucleoside-diphosphate-sugar epimerase
MADAVLVTGATGFIGQHLVAALKDAGRLVYGHSRRDGDIASCQLSFGGVRHVLHLAGKAFVPDSWTQPSSYYATNVLGTVNVLEYCRRIGASLTFVSSYVYGRPRRLPIDEDHPLEPFNPYSHTKILAESVALFYAQAFDLTVSVVRPFNVYGPGQAAHYLIPQVISQAIDPAVEFIDVSDLEPRRDYIYVGDLVSMLVALVLFEASGIYNAGSGQSVSVQEVVNEIQGITGTRKPVRSLGQPRQNEIPDVIADISRAQRAFGWSPQITLRQGLQMTVDSMRKQPQ